MKEFDTGEVSVRSVLHGAVTPQAQVIADLVEGEDGKESADESRATPEASRRLARRGIRHRLLQ
ncbi:hypothetical protein CJ179_14075 [Rhodococcus sp. ACS1]|nr:hypothetical protein CJ179_14075 [Rhodococcus sp. ACS1]